MKIESLDKLEEKGILQELTTEEAASIQGGLIALPTDGEYKPIPLPPPKCYPLPLPPKCHFPKRKDGISTRIISCPVIL